MRAALVAALLLGPACFGGTTDTTDSGLGKPRLTIEAPATAERGSTHDVVMTVENPGPGDIRSLAVAFALVGPVQEDGSLPTPVIGTGTDGEVVETDPETSGISDDGSVFVFGGGGGEPVLPEGETLAITFTVEMPGKQGLAANSVQVYDGNEVDRADGGRLEIRIR